MLPQLLSKFSGFITALTLATPFAAIAAAAVLDIGPDGHPRFSVFPLVLTLYDPVIATSLGHSVIMAAAIAASSALVGGLLGSLLGVRRFWGRPVLDHLLAPLAVVPPAFLALGVLGLRGWLGSEMLEPSGASRETDSFGFPFGWRWAAWAWVGSIPATAMVMEATVRGLARLEPDWGAAARLAGAPRWRIWLDVTWPSLRPRILAVALGCFVLAMVDPGPPLILGLRRTLGFQIVASIQAAEPFPRLAAASLITLIVAFLVRSIWGMRARLPRPSLSRNQAEDAAKNRADRRSTGFTPRTAIAGIVLAAASGLLWSPVAGLVRLALDGSPDAPDLGAPPGVWATPVLESLLRSIVLAVSFGLVFAISARGLRWDRPAPSVERTQTALRLAYQSAPPLIIGVGVLSAIRLLFLASTWLGSEAIAGESSVATLMVGFGLVNPATTPGILVVAAVCLAHLPGHLLESRAGEPDQELWTRRIEQARLTGVGRMRALELARAGARGIPLSHVLLWSILAATSVAPAIAVGGTDPGWGVGPVIVSLSEGTIDQRRQAAILALGAIGLSLLAWGIHRSRGAGTPRPIQ